MFIATAILTHSKLRQEQNVRHSAPTGLELNVIR